MLQLINKTPLAVEMMTLPDVNGVEALVLAVKGTFSLSERPVLREAQVPIQLESVYDDEPGCSSPRLLSECHLPKPSSDVVLEGMAHAPGGKTVTELDVGLRVGRVEKTIRVIGDRWFLNGEPTQPEVFTKMPLVYERAFGGTIPRDKQPQTEFEPRNPIGRGFTGKKKSLPDEAPLPNLEAPDAPYSKGKTVPVVGFSWIDPSWLPRRGYAGTYDEAWKKKRMPFLPEDFDTRFFNAAHPDLVYPGFLEGGEPVTLINLTADRPRIDFRLPSIRFETEAIVGRKASTIDLNLETLFLQPEEHRFCLTWRGLLGCPDGATSLRQVRLELADRP